MLAPCFLIVPAAGHIFRKFFPGKPRVIGLTEKSPSVLISIERFKYKDLSGVGQVAAYMDPFCNVVSQLGGRIKATVKLDTGSNVAVDILFAHPRTKPSAGLHESLGLATVNTPLGIVLKVDERRETSMPGIYAAGDLANPLMPSVTVASSHGATAGISTQQSMLV